MVALKGDKEIGDKINKIIGALAEENSLKGVINVADFNDEAILVTTQVSDRIGVPRPIRLTVRPEGYAAPIEQIMDATLKLTLGVAE